MPPEDDKTTVEVNETEVAAQPKKGGNKMLLFGGIGVGAIAIGIALAVFVIVPMMSDGGGGSDQASTEEVAQDSHAKPGGHGEAEKKASHGKKKKEGDALVYAIENIVVNPSGTGGSRFLSVSFGFELESRELEESFHSREALVRDALITILSSKTVAQLTDTREKEVTRYQIKKRLEKLMHTDGIAGVYYTDFVLQ